MLDDLKRIAELDVEDTLGVAERQAAQLTWEFDVQSEHLDVQNIVLAGMGGSALYAEIYKVWPGPQLPFEIVRDYNIPPYVNEDTLFIASSFSGNTEETLEALAQAQAAGAHIAIITAGGKLKEIAAEKSYPVALLDSSIPQPRMSAYNALKALLTILEAAGIEEGRVAELMAAGERVADAGAKWRADVHSKDNEAKQVAFELMGKSVVSYSGRQMFPVANKLKININENAKNIAWTNYFSEQNHNEFIGWSSHPIDKPYAIVNIHSEFEHPRIAKRFEVQDRLLSGQRPQPINIRLQGDSKIDQILYGIMLVDMISLYLGLLNGKNPAPVALVEKMKVSLDE